MDLEIKKTLDEMIDKLAEMGSKTALFMKKVDELEKMLMEFSPNKFNDEQYDKVNAILQACIDELKKI